MSRLFGLGFGLTLGLGFIALAAFVILSPFVTIWSLNTLFPVLAIPYTLETYGAALVLSMLLGSTSFSNK